MVKDHMAEGQSFEIRLLMPLMIPMPCIAVLLQGTAKKKPERTSSVEKYAF